jgi:beta-lactamase regulating signal transducer with metallopeptidase domain
MSFFNIFKGFALNTAAETEAVTETVEKISQDIIFDISRFPGTLKHMGIGMLSIFLVIGVIILAVYALNKIMTAIESKRAKKNENEQ